LARRRVRRPGSAAAAAEHQRPFPAHRREELLSESEPTMPLPDATVEAAALANLARVAREIDEDHLGRYAEPAEVPPSPGEVAKRFLDALGLEYARHEDLLARRLQVLASMAFVSAPEVVTDPG